MYCGAVSDSESILLVSTDKRSLIGFSRTDDSAEWKEFCRTTSPNEDIYYTAISCIPLTSEDVLLFLGGTDNSLYFSHLSLVDHSIRPLGSLTVVSASL